MPEKTLNPYEVYKLETDIHGTSIKGLRPIDVEDCECPEPHPPAQLLGHTYFCGVFCHVHFVRVHYPDGVQSPVCDPHDRWSDVCALDDCVFDTVQLEEYEGDWVLWLHPGPR